MDIAQLKAFLAVAATRSFSQAAEQLFVTQPAISKRIAALEEELDARLFDRIGRRVELTDAGRTLLPRAKSILLEVEDCVRAVSSLEGKVQGNLRFATSHHIGLHRLPRALKAFTRHYPLVQLDIRFMDSEAACHAVEQGELELAIVTLPPDPSASLTTRIIWPDPLSVLAARGHEMTRKRITDIRELSRYPAILPATNTYTRQIAEKAFRIRGIRLDVTLSTNYLETIKMLVSVGIGWSLLPVTMLDRQVSEIAVPELKLSRNLGVVIHRERTLSNAAIALMERLQHAAAKQPA